MTLLELLDKANGGYPDGFLAEYYDNSTGMPISWASAEGKGDTFAYSIVLEIAETFDSGVSTAEQLSEASRVIRQVVIELENVIAEL